MLTNYMSACLLKLERCSKVLAAFLIVLLFTACAETPDKGDDDKPTPWTNTKVQLTYNLSDSEIGVTPKQILLEYVQAIIPKNTETPNLIPQEYHDNVAELKKRVGSQYVRISKNKIMPDAVYSYFPSLDPVKHFEIIAKNPVIKGIVIREYEKKKNWSSQVRAAYATLRISQGKLAEVDILSHKVSLELASYLRYINGVEAIVVDRDGIVLAATQQWVYPTIHKQNSWSILAEADGASILIGPPFNEAPYDFQLRRVAIPIHEDSQNDLAGWIIGKVLNNNRFQ